MRRCPCKAHMLSDLGWAFDGSCQACCWLKVVLTNAICGEGSLLIYDRMNDHGVYCGIQILGLQIPVVSQFQSNGRMTIDWGAVSTPVA